MSVDTWRISELSNYLQVLFAQSPLHYSLSLSTPSPAPLHGGSPFLFFFRTSFLLHERLIAETDYRDTAKTDKATEQKITHICINLQAALC